MFKNAINIGLYTVEIENNNGWYEKLKREVDNDHEVFHILVGVVENATFERIFDEILGAKCEQIVVKIRVRIDRVEIGVEQQLILRDVRRLQRRRLYRIATI